MTNVPNSVLDAYTQHRHGVPVHDAIWGPIASGKTYTVRQLLNKEYKAAVVESWVVDVNMSMPEVEFLVNRYATKLPAVRDLLSAALMVDHLSGCTLRTVTIDDAHDVLDDGECRFLTEQIAKYGPRNGVKLRLVVPSLELRAFGGSAVLQAAVSEGNTLKAAHHG